MHEASLCDALFDQVDQHLAAHPGAVARVVRVAIGELAGVEPELFTIAFEALRGERHPGAVLELVHVPARWRCPGCATERAHRAGGGGPLACAACGRPLALVAGGELTLERLELEVPSREVDDV